MALAALAKRHSSQMFGKAPLFVALQQKRLPAQVPAPMVPANKAKRPV
jgi:hypothetical protein